MRKAFAGRTDWNLEKNRLAEVLGQRRAAGKRVIDLTASNPTTCGFEYDHHAILRALCAPGALVYEPNPKGLERARQAVVGYYADRGDPVMTNDTILTTSTSEAYSFVFRLLCDPGDEILIPQPSYPLFDFLADIHDVKLARYPLVYDHGWLIDFHSLEKAITSRTRGMIVVHPNNPTGHFCKPEERAKLNELCSDHNMAIIADEVFLDFALDESADEQGAGTFAPDHRSKSSKPASFAANTQTLTFTMSGVSKICGLPQMKAAWLVVSGPEPLKSQALARLEVIADTYLSMNAPVQLAMPIFLGQRDQFRKQVITRIGRNLAELDRQLAAQNAFTRLEVEGAWYAVIKLPAANSASGFTIHLLENQGVYVHPGHFYEFAECGYVVVSAIVPESEFAEGVRGLIA